jgi:hypothetical protein
MNVNIAENNIIPINYLNSRMSSICLDVLVTPYDLLVVDNIVGWLDGSKTVVVPMSDMIVSALDKRLDWLQHTRCSGCHRQVQRGHHS